MATTKIGIYRKYTGPVPTDGAGRPLPKEQWPDKRPHVWVARWFGADGKRYSKKFKTRKEAERFAEPKQQDVRAGKGDMPGRMTLEQFHDEHAKLGRATLRRTSLIVHLATLALFAGHFGWQRDIRRVRQVDIEQFLAERAKSVSKTTVKKELKTLNRLFNIAIDRGHLSRGCNPCEAVPIPNVGKTKIVYCPPDDFTAIFSKASGQLMRTILLLWYTTGLRRSEAEHLLWDDVDLTQKHVTVARHRAEGYVQEWSPKDHELRTIPMPAQLAAALRELKAAAPMGCPYVFMSAARWAYYREKVDAGTWSEKAHLINNMLRKFKTTCKKAGVREYEIHDLRRSCITNWAKKAPVHVVRELAGHASLTTTQEYYLSVQSEDLKIAQRYQEEVVAAVESITVTDPKVTPKAEKREFPKRKELQPLRKY